MTTINVKDASGATIAVARVADTGQAAMAASLPVAIASDQGVVPVRYAGTTTTSISGTITTGGTAQNAAAANASRRGFWIQNQSGGDLWISDVGTAALTQPSLRLPAEGYFESPPGSATTGAISIIGATTGQAFAGRQW